MKVVVVDDSKPFQQNLSRWLAPVAGIVIVGYAEDVAGARQVIDALNPDLVVLDVELRNGDRGLDVLRHVVREHPATKVVTLSNMNWQALKQAYLQAGAEAYFDKSMEFEEARAWIAACAQRAAAGGKPE